MVSRPDTCKGHPHGQLGSNMDLSLFGAREKLIFICLFIDNKCSLCTHITCSCSDSRFVVLDSRPSDLSLSPGWDHCAMSSSKTLAFTVPLSAQVGSSQFNVGGNPMIDYHPIQVGK